METVEKQSVSAYVMPGIITQTVSVKSIESAVCRFYGIEQDQLKLKTREWPIIEARQVSMYFQRLYTKQSFASIAKHYGKNHCTVFHACKTVSNIAETNREFRRNIELLDNNIRQTHGIR